MEQQSSTRGEQFAQHQGVYIGIRGEQFTQFLSNLFTEAGIDEQYIEAMLSPDNIPLFERAFTSGRVIGRDFNYEPLEQIGDAFMTAFIVQYLYARFPILKCSEGVKVVARLRINLVSKSSFSRIANDIGLFPFITALEQNRVEQEKDGKDSLAEDVFEALMGAICDFMDSHYGIGSGYAQVYKILGTIFDRMNITIRYEDLYDSITRLKEVGDMYDPAVAGQTGKARALQVRHFRDSETNMTTSTYTWNRQVIGQATASLQKDAETEAANIGLATLAQRGMVKHPPAIYAQFERGQLDDPRMTRKDIDSIASTINELVPVKGQANIRPRPMNTVLHRAAQNLDTNAIIYALERGANPSIADNYGIYPMDHLLLYCCSSNCPTALIASIGQRKQAAFRANESVLRFTASKRPDLLVALLSLNMFDADTANVARSLISTTPAGMDDDEIDDEIELKFVHDEKTPLHKARFVQFGTKKDKDFEWSEPVRIEENDELLKKYPYLDVKRTIYRNKKHGESGVRVLTVIE